MGPSKGQTGSQEDSQEEDDLDGMEEEEDEEEEEDDEAGELPSAPEMKQELIMAIRDEMEEY